jgi:hypothetical protein
MSLKDIVYSILSNDSLDSDKCEESKCLEIEKLILEYSWEAMQEIMIDILLDDQRRISDYEVVAQVFWGASLDDRDVCINKVIALLYYRLPKDKNSSENNLTWSITSRLKKVDYLSDYDPMKDEEIIQERIHLGIA